MFRKDVLVVEIATASVLLNALSFPEDLRNNCDSCKTSSLNNRWCLHELHRRYKVSLPILELHVASSRLRVAEKLVIIIVEKYFCCHSSSHCH